MLVSAVCKRVGSLRHVLEDCCRQPCFQRPYLHSLTALNSTASDSLRSKSTGPPTSMHGKVDKLWRKFFADPSQWWDHRAGKRNPSYPDFKHKKSGQGLWVSGQWNPPWVEGKVASLAPGAVQLNTFSYNSLLGRYTKDGKYEETLLLFQRMQDEGVTLDRYSFVPLITACGKLRALEKGRRVHEQVAKLGLESDALVGGSLIGMYSKCGRIEDASKVFERLAAPDNGAWNAMILGFAKCGEGQRALELSQQMQNSGLQPDPLTFVGVLSACANVGALQEGKDVHSQILRSGCETQVFVGSSLVNMYAKCGSIDDAWILFKKMPKRDTATWNTMISGLVKNSRGHKALELSWQMRNEGFTPNAITFIAILNACASIGAFEEGKRVHEQIIQAGLQSDAFLASSLVDMYAKCGSIEDAWAVFKTTPTFGNDKVVWSAMLGGFAMHGQAHKALRLFEVMCEKSVQIDKVILVQLLSACSHAGLVDEGLHFFAAVTSGHGLSPTIEHYTCIVDLLGRAGRLQEAEEMISVVPDADAAMGKALLAACRVHGSTEMGERIAHRVLALEPESSSGFVLLSNLYADTGRFESSDTIHEHRIKIGVKKQPGRTWVEVNNQVHTFTADDAEHPERIAVHEELRRLCIQMEGAGYTAKSEVDVRHPDNEGKRSRASQHSEKLALAFGLMRTSGSSALRLFKNLRICGDCHTFFKFISKMLGRELVVRDVIRFHHFKHGMCTCGEFW